MSLFFVFNSFKIIFCIQFLRTFSLKSDYSLLIFSLLYLVFFDYQYGLFANRRGEPRILGIKKPRLANQRGGVCEPLGTLWVYPRQA